MPGSVPAPPDYHSDVDVKDQILSIYSYVQALYESLTWQLLHLDTRNMNTVEVGGWSASQINQILTPTKAMAQAALTLAQTALQSVATDSTLTGNGAGGSPLSVTPPAYTPTNFTPTSDTIDGYFEGIDIAIGGG
jgi:hypothetical protein